MQKTKEQVMKELAEPFLTAAGTPDIYWKVASTFRDSSGDYCQLVPYIDARHVYSRLNLVMGGDWSKKLDKYGEATVCVISIKFPVDGWVDRDGAAGNTKIEPEKGADSKATVRAAVPWGIGAYLYDVPSVILPYKDKFPYDLTGKVKLHTRDAVSGYINTSFSLELMKLTEFWKSLPEVMRNNENVKTKFSQLWEMFVKK